VAGTVTAAPCPALTMMSGGNPLRH